MRKQKIILLITLLSAMLVGCGDNTGRETQSDNTKNSNEIVSTEQNNNSNKNESKDLTIEELEAQLSNQPIVINRTEYVVQDEQLKALYPDGLRVVLQNNSNIDIKNLKVGFVAWDSNNLPVKISAQFDYSGGSYFKEVFCDDANMVPGGTYGENHLYNIDENNNIATFKAIVISYEGFEGETWENPLLDEFRKIYENKKLKTQ